MRTSQCFILLAFVSFSSISQLLAADREPSVSPEHFGVARESSRFLAWPANHGPGWSWGREVLVAFCAGTHAQQGAANHKFITAGFGEWKQADYATAALAEDGSCAVVYLPTPRTFTVDLVKLKAPVTARWFDPTNGKFQDVPGSPFASTGKGEFTPAVKNAAGDADWVLVLSLSHP